tara:strand:- start:222 stop:1136 length:915 start_codon:yes stop_codon:yes gene_type:complete
MKRILITGSRGMLGKDLVRKLNSKIFTPNKKKLNLFNFTDTKKYIKKNKINFVIHCAAKVGGIQDNVNHQLEYLVENLNLNKNIIMASYENGVKNFLNIGSSCIYPKNIKKKITENLMFKGDFEPTNEGYAISKYLSIKLCKFISQKEGYNYKTLIPTNLYGPNDKYDKEKSHLLAAIIKKISNAKKTKNKYVEIWGDGKARREFMYVSDLSDAILFSIKNFNRLPNILNIGTGIDYTVEAYYKKVAKIIYPKVKFYFNRKKPSGMRRKLLDVSKSKKLGWSAKVSLTNGIKKTLKDYRKYYEN